MSLVFPEPAVLTLVADRIVEGSLTYPVEPEYGGHARLSPLNKMLALE